MTNEDINDFSDALKRLNDRTGGNLRIGQALHGALSTARTKATHFDMKTEELVAILDSFSGDGGAKK